MTNKPAEVTREHRERVRALFICNGWDEDRQFSNRINAWVETGAIVNKSCDRWHDWAQAIADAEERGRREAALSLSLLVGEFLEGLQYPPEKEPRLLALMRGCGAALEPK